MDKTKAINNVEFSNDDKERILSLSKVMEDHVEEIIDEVIAVVAKDDRVLDILKKDGITANDAKNAWIGSLKMLFSQPMDDVMFGKMFEIGVVHVDKGVNEELVIEAMNLMMLKTLEVFSKYIDVDRKVYFSIVKLFAVALSAMITSYSEEQERRKESLLRSLGISGDLLKRLIVNDGV